MVQLSGDDQTVQLAAFRVGQEEYVVDILRVREIIRPLPITEVRKGPRFVEGVINLRGLVVPVVDLRRRFDLPTDSGQDRRFVITMVDGRSIALVVDEVTDVVRLASSEIRRAPGLLDSQRAPFFLGVCCYQGRTLILLNVKNILATEDLIAVPSASELMRDEV